MIKGELKSIDAKLIGTTIQLDIVVKDKTFSQTAICRAGVIDDSRYDFKEWHLDEVKNHFIELFNRYMLADKKVTWDDIKMQSIYCWA